VSELPWKLYRFRYEDYPEYSARITGHYAGDMLIIEEEGELSEEAVKLLKTALGIEEDSRKFDIEPKDLMKLPIEKLPTEDRKTLLAAMEKLDSESKLHVEYRYQPSFD
jgi:RNA binding exosome subunit